MNDNAARGPSAMINGQTTSSLVPVWLLTCLLAVATIGAASAQKGSAAGGQTSTSAAQAKLKRMQDYLRRSSDLSFTTTVTSSSALGNVRRRATAVFLTRQPNQFRVELKQHNGKTIFVSDGKTLTIYSPSKRRYAQYPAGRSLLATMYSAVGLMNLAGRMLDFFWAVDRKSIGDTEISATQIPSIRQGGRDCQGISVQRFEEQFDVWLPAQGTPLPCKLITRRSDGSSMTTHTHVFTWTKTPSFDDGAFSFVPPQGSRPGRALDIQ